MTSTGCRLGRIQSAALYAAGCRRRHSTPQAGFTLIELVMVIVLLGVLSVVAIPRLVSSNDVSGRGFHDSTLAYLRYAQKTAVAQRRTVCVTFNGTGGLSLSMALAAASYTCAATPAVTGPGSNGSATLAASSGAAYSAAPANFGFDGLGQPVNLPAGTTIATAQAIQVLGAGATITVEPVTGYVHD